ncbi:MAG: TetR family transcriptional regulator, partial [Pseudarcicella sp.]|nr:TetR family transcriptional regulator [Pseudarcicella sp.]
FKGARTTQIAEEAEISRTMLHYYFRSKEMLFEEVMNNTLKILFSHFKKVFTNDKSLAELVCHLVDIIADVLQEKPGLPSFIVNILNESPDLVTFLASNKEDNLPQLLDELIAKNSLKHSLQSENLTGEDLILNIYGLCAMPYLAYDYIKAKENRTDDAMKEFIFQRRQKTKSLLLAGL